jgi:hypothetical protein
MKWIGRVGGWMDQKLMWNSLEEAATYLIMDIGQIDVEKGSQLLRIGQMNGCGG